jgi:hypothetical protein
VLLGSCDGAPHQVAVSGADIDAAGDLEQAGASVLLKASPQVISSQHQRDVIGTLSVGLADHA